MICEQLAQELDPIGEEKAMIFCATDAHADMVKRLLNEAFKAVHGDQFNQAAVEKITGASDKVDQLIRRYKNERFPTIAITVDLLTTGIDVPPICQPREGATICSGFHAELLTSCTSKPCHPPSSTPSEQHSKFSGYRLLSSSHVGIRSRR